MNMILERQSDGNYTFTESEPAPKAEMKQQFTEEEIANLISLRKESHTANMEMSFGGISGMFDKVTNMEVMGIPIGAAAVGGALAIVLDRIVLAKLDPTNKWGSYANLALALVVKKWGSKFLGNKAADATAMILTYEAVADWVTMGINKVWPTKAVAAVKSSGTMRQFESVANDYYSQALGR
jgi:hypothetical protein